MADITPALAAIQVTADLSETLISLLAYGLLILPVLGFIGTCYMWAVYLSDQNRPRSWVLFQMAGGSTVVWLTSLAIGYLAVERLFGAPAIVNGLLILAVSLVILELVPIWYAFTIRRKRRDSRNDPPFGGE